MEEFRNIGIIGRLGSTKVVDTVRRLKRYLVEEGYHVILQDRIAEIMPGHGMQVSNQKMLGEICDLVIVVGGDGSLLGAARALAKHNTPVLGINRGRLGFLTDISPDEGMEAAIQAVLDGEYIEEQRFLLDAEIKRNGVSIATGEALNDVVLHPGKSARMIAFVLYIEALSGGGPIMHPRLDAIVLVPMFPHTLSSRPMVVEGNSEIKLVIGESNETYPTVSCDGQKHIPCAPGDAVTIRKKPHKLKLIHPKDHNFYEVCRNKLGWEKAGG
jgi:NAD+ kinase